MASEVINGTDVLLFISPTTGTTTWTAIGHSTSFSLNLTRATRETSSKDTGDVVTRAKGRLDITGSMEGLVLDDDKYNIEDFESLIITGDPVLMIFGKETVAGNGIPYTTSTDGGSHFFASGEFLITNVSATYPDQANSTYSVSFEHSAGFDINHLYST